MTVLSATIEQIWPTGAERLLQCALSFSVGQTRDRRSGVANGAALLGTAAHEALERAVRDRSILSDSWANELAHGWSRRISSLAGQYPALGPPEQWPGYEIKRARLANMGAEIRGLLEPLGSEALLLPEEHLASGTCPLRGIVDLIVRSDTSHLIVDYKTGTVLDPDSKEPRGAYRRQLQLYAFLEWEASGSWPDRAVLIPGRGEPVDVSVDPQECTDTVEQALALVEAYNSRVPDVQPANPSQASCRYCPHLFDCAVFWEAVDGGRMEELGAFRGTVEDVSHTPFGGFEVTMRSDQGSGEPLRVAQIHAEVHPGIRQVAVGAKVAVVGLWLTESGNSGLRLRRNARLQFT